MRENFSLKSKAFAGVRTRQTRVFAPRVATHGSSKDSERTAHQEGRPVNDEISFQSAEGLRFTADINVSYQLTAGQVPRFYVKFRSDDLDAFTHGFSAMRCETHFGYRRLTAPGKSTA